jgi:hypothetical protein
MDMVIPCRLSGKVVSVGKRSGGPVDARPMRNMKFL